MAIFDVAIYVLGAIWIYRIAANLRVHGVWDLTNSPGWSIGWYFIPIANFWKPYQAMKEIWQASASPQQWRDSTVPSLLPVWWTLWLLSFFLPFGISLATGLHADAAGGWLSSNATTMATRFIDIPLSLVFAQMMGCIWRMQANHTPPKPPALPAFDAAS